MLTEYFMMCETDPDAIKLLYGDFPEHYTWDSKNKRWNKQIQVKVIGRINGVNPVEGVKCYLRLLLNHIRGPTSFIDLLTVDNVRSASFKEAAQRIKGAVGN